MERPIQYIQIPVVYEKSDTAKQVSVAVDRSDRTILATKLQLLAELDRLEQKFQKEQISVDSSS